MPGLREMLLQDQPAMRASIRPPPAPIHCERMANELRERIGSQMPRPPDRDLLRAVYTRLERIAAAGGRGMAELSSADLRKAPWVLFQPFGDQPGAAPLAARRGFLASYLTELQSRGQASALATLIYCFVLFYPHALAGFNQLREFIVSHLKLGATSLRIQRWQVCGDKCGLFAADAPLRLAGQLAYSDQSPEAVLDDCRLRGLLATGGLVLAAYRELVVAVRQQLGQNSVPSATVERLLSLSRANDDPQSLRFKTERVALIDGLLLPFAEGQPNPALAERIKDSLLDLFGDPRLTGRQRWNGVDPRARQVMLGWLVTETLEDFFRLLEYAAQSDPIARRHWQARKILWTRYLNAGTISDAWVALGPLARFQARGMLSGSDASYAKLSGVQNNQSAIIMRIGELLITEWSHSGSFRAWPPNARTRPKLYKSDYSRAELVQGAEPKNVIEHRGDWQTRVKDLIYHQTGISP